MNQMKPLYSMCPNVMKQKIAFPPNFIRSIDSSHMMLTSLFCEWKGLTFVSVHDCYWTHPSSVETMNQVCREQFVLLHSEPILEDLSAFLIEMYLLKNPFTAIYYGPTDVKQLPLIVMPHGGLHSSFACEYSSTTTLFGLLRFGMLMVNYRGSTGEWEQTLRTLPGAVGKVDVEDVREATSEALKAFPFLDPSLIFLFGGSHGGFLVTLLSGLFSNDYRAVVTRNPVIDVASMCVTSDIPDWCTVESGVGEWTGDGMASIHTDLKALSKMRNLSPLMHANEVKAPTLVMIGRQDQRVPPAQGLLYYRCLKSCGVKTRLLVYDDCHSLSKVSNELDNLINSALWFIEHGFSKSKE